MLFLKLGDELLGIFLNILSLLILIFLQVFVVVQQVLKLIFKILMKVSRFCCSKFFVALEREVFGFEAGDYVFLRVYYDLMILITLPLFLLRLKSSFLPFFLDFAKPFNLYGIKNIIHNML